MVKTIKSSMSQARKKMLEQIKNKEESEVKRKKTTKEKYKELRESIKGPEPTPQSFSDKFEEELKRMEQILRGAKKNTLILLNESFATTTEVTAYQIAMDLMHTCLSEAVTVWMVTHITKFAKELYGEHPEIRC